MESKNWWWLSLIVSAVFIVVLVQLWSLMNHYEIEPTQLTNAEAVDRYLQDNWENIEQNGRVVSVPLTKIPTGIFIQSLKFFNSTEVNLTGYIWQRYTDGVNDNYKPDSNTAGFILPEQVQTGNDIEPKEVYRVRQGEEETVGWYFEATLRQPFDYFFYPFDHKTVWVRLWPKEFSGNVVLVPDFAAYKATGLKDVFGIDNEIVLGTWERDNTYFDFRPTCYDTNFGIDNYVGQEGFPELHYNFVIKRKSGNAFIVYMLPLFLVAALLFSALLTVTAEPNLASTHGFNTSGVLGTCSVLFFVVLLAHIQLREQFAGSSIVYMEYFYFLMYGMLVAAGANTYMFSMKAAPTLKIIHYQDNLIPKVLYWPAVLLFMIAITSYVLWGVGAADVRQMDKCSPGASSAYFHSAAPRVASAVTHSLPLNHAHFGTGTP